MTTEKENDWRQTRDGRDFLALVYESAVANGWSRKSVGSSVREAKSLDVFKERAQRYFSPKQPRELDWRDTKEGAEFLARVYESAAANGWSRRSVGNSAGRAKSLDEFKGWTQRYFAPPLDETPIEKWGDWIQEQQITAGIPVVKNGTSWTKNWKLRVLGSPSNHPDIEQSARAFVADKLKDLEYWKVVEEARNGGLEEKAELLQAWLIEDRYNNFPLDTTKLETNEQGKIYLMALETSVMKIARKKKWSHLQSILTKAFWIELSRALHEQEKEAAAA